MYLFNEQLNNEQDWGNVFQSIAAFTPLVEHILEIEKLPPAKIENLSPGTNALFKIDKHVIKIYVPAANILVYYSIYTKRKSFVNSQSKSHSGEGSGV